MVQVGQESTAFRFILLLCPHSHRGLQCRKLGSVPTVMLELPITTGTIARSASGFTCRSGGGAGSCGKSRAPSPETQRALEEQTASNLLPMASNPIAMASNLLPMASNPIAMASNLTASSRAQWSSFKPVSNPCSLPRQLPHPPAKLGCSDVKNRETCQRELLPTKSFAGRSTCRGRRSISWA